MDIHINSDEFERVSDWLQYTGKNDLYGEELYEHDVFKFDFRDNEDIYIPS